MDERLKNIKKYLDSVRYEYNDSVFQAMFVKTFPYTKCDYSINTPQVIDSNAFRFILDGVLYEYV